MSIKQRHQECLHRGEHRVYLIKQPLIREKFNKTTTDK